MKNIALVGFMGTGKTAVARILAERFKADFVDLDSLIEEKENMKIADIFSLKGEPYFRQIEKDVVREISSKQGKIVACGGGVVLDEENIRNLKKGGFLICLSARPEIIFERTMSYTYRPLLNVKDPKAKIEELLRLRQPYYAQADYTVDTSNLSLEDVVGMILKWLKRKI